MKHHYCHYVILWWIIYDLFNVSATHGWYFVNKFINNSEIIEFTSYVR